MKLDALFFGAHPDDVELTSGGLAALLAGHGHRVGIVDLTRGERASRGTPEERAKEAAAAGEILGVAMRTSANLPDVGIHRNDPTQLRTVVGLLRTHAPRLVVAPDADDPHPDHVEGSHLVARACYVAGLARFDAPGERHRPERLLFALYRGDARPHLVVDISRTWEKRMKALHAHHSQLDPGRGPETYLTQPGFLGEVEARARAFGARIGATHGEGYRVRAPLAVTDARVLLGAGAMS
jgi:bacillithiol biosynthesis deacetylase BshB1